MKQKTIWEIEDRKEFYNNLESILRRDMSNKGIDYCIQYFVSEHIDEISLEFLREVKKKINWKDLYHAIAFNRKIDLIKGSKKYKEFFKKFENEY